MSRAGECRRNGEGPDGRHCRCGHGWIAVVHPVRLSPALCTDCAQDWCARDWIQRTGTDDGPDPMDPRAPRRTTNKGCRELAPPRVATPCGFKSHSGHWRRRSDAHVRALRSSSTAVPTKRGGCCRPTRRRGSQATAMPYSPRITTTSSCVTWARVRWPAVTSAVMPRSPRSVRRRCVRCALGGCGAYCSNGCRTARCVSAGCSTRTSGSSTNCGGELVRRPRRTPAAG